MSEIDKFIFRNAKIEDISIIFGMIKDLASFQNMEGPTLNENDLIRDAGLDGGGKEYCHIYVLEDPNNKILVAYAICCYSYSTWTGKLYVLEDIFVREDYRGKGVGSRLFKEVAAKAHELDCTKVDFHVLEWNKARDFYAKMGAIDLTEIEKWHFYRLPKSEMIKISNELKTTK